MQVAAGAEADGVHGPPQSALQQQGRRILYHYEMSKPRILETKARMNGHGRKVVPFWLASLGNSDRDKIFQGTSKGSSIECAKILVLFSPQGLGIRGALSLVGARENIERTLREG